MALPVPVRWRDAEEHFRKLADAINGILTGHTNNAGSTTLNASSTSTVINDPRIGGDTVFIPMAKTASAARALDLWYVTGRGDGTLTLNHVSDAANDQDIDYVLIATGQG